MSFTKKILALIITSAFFAFSSFAECITSEKFNYTIDFPEGIQIDDMEQDETIVVLSHKIFQLKCLLRIWPAQSYKTSKAALEDSMKKLSLQNEIMECKWRNLPCAVSMFEGTIEGVSSNGWAECIPLPDNKGYLTVMTYASHEVSENLEPVMVSILDSVIIDYASTMESGLITSVFYPPQGKQDVTLKIGNNTIKTSIDKSDSEANQFVLDREWNIFLIYAQNLDISKPNESKVLIPAWQRFYRIVAKDSMGRLKTVSNDIYKTYMPLLTSPDSATNDLTLAQELLTWTQNFEYNRDAQQIEHADITNVIDVINGKGNDCDSRSMLLAVIMKNLGMDTCFFISAQYGHAMFGIHLEGKQGQTIKVDNTEYLVGETTAKDVTIGKIAQDMADRKYWYPVEFY